MGLTLATGTCSDKLCVTGEDDDRRRRKRVPKSESKGTDNINNDRIEELSQKDFIDIGQSNANTNTNGFETGENLQRSDSEKKQELQPAYSPRSCRGIVPICPDCGGTFHIQNDPIHAYDEVGIFCGLCGKNRNDNPEMVLENHYYKCSKCLSVDICSVCYMKEKGRAIEKTKDTESK